MREILVGRLEWDKSAHGIAVRIPARVGSAFALFGPVIAVWLIFSSSRLFTQSASNAPDDRADLIWTVVAGAVVTVIILIAWLAWAFTSDTLLSLDETQLKIQRRVLGIELVTHSFPTTEVHNFTFVPPAKFWASKGTTDIRTSKIIFQSRGKSYAFAEGVTKAEAEILIEQMIEVFKFPDFIAAPAVSIQR